MPTLNLLVADSSDHDSSADDEEVLPDLLECDSDSEEDDEDDFRIGGGDLEDDHGLADDEEVLPDLLECDSDSEDDFSPRDFYGDDHYDYRVDDYGEPYSDGGYRSHSFNDVAGTDVPAGDDEDVDMRSVLSDHDSSVCCAVCL